MLIFNVCMGPIKKHFYLFGLCVCLSSQTCSHLLFCSASRLALPTASLMSSPAPPQGGVARHCLQGADCCGVLLLTPMCLFHTVATPSLTPCCDSWIWHSQYAWGPPAGHCPLSRMMAGEKGRTTLTWGQNVVRATGLGLIMWRSWQSLTAMEFITISKTILIIMLAFPFTFEPLKSRNYASKWLMPWYW